MKIEFNEEIIKIFERHEDEPIKEFYTTIYEFYEYLTENYPSTYTFIDLNVEPDDESKALQYLPGWIQMIEYSSNYRTVELMEDYVNSVNEQNLLSTILLERGILENSANIFHYCKRLEKSTHRVKSSYKKILKGDTTHKNETYRSFSEGIYNSVKTIQDFLCKSVVTKIKTEDDEWRKKYDFYLKNDERITKLIGELPTELFEKKTPKEWYFDLCNYSHPNSESQCLNLIDAKTNGEITQYTFSRNIKNPVVTGNLLELLCFPVLGSIETIGQSLELLENCVIFFTNLNETWSKLK